MRCINTCAAIIVAIIGTCQAEYFSSMDSLSSLSAIEAKLIDISRTYFERKEKELKQFESFIEHVKREHSKAAVSVEDYVGNPINAFKLIKRTVIDWNNVHSLVKESPAVIAFLEELESLNQKGDVPNTDDLIGAAKGFDRLQRFYNIDAEEFADGVIDNVKHGHTLTWHDCYELAVNFYDIKLYKRAIEWFQLALEKMLGFDSVFMHEQQLQNIELNIYEHLAIAFYELGYNDTALQYIDDVLNVVPDHPIKDTKIFVQHNVDLKKPTEPPPAFSWWGNYTRLCRGELVPDSSKLKLKCYLDSQRHAMFRLAPLKVEQLNFNPEIMLYHHLLSDALIENVVAEGANKMMRSSVLDGSASKVSEVRNSQQAWLPYDSAVMASIKRLVQQISGLDFNNIEIMQLANYGIGGQYDCHHDFFGPKYRNDAYLGDRIATTMFYLSNVAQGGYTVFPYLNTYSAPEKGSLVMWYNLHKSLREDYRTLHGGCPVLKGTKRIGNIWIHSGLQELKRPCALHDDSLESYEQRYL